MGSRIIFNIALGPKHVLMTSATVYIGQFDSMLGILAADLCCYDISGLSFPSGLTLGPDIYLLDFALEISHNIKLTHNHHLT
jgi:hypothetical protein